MRWSSSRLFRNAVLLPLLAAALLVSGCVYLRLLELKRQLAHFDQNFTAESNDGIRIHCRNPVLLGDDLRWLGAEPKSVVRTADGELWRVRWVKEPPAGVKEDVIYDVDLDARLTDGMLAEVHIPERFFAYFPKELFLGLLKSAGNAKVDRSDRSAKTVTDSPKSVPMPVFDTITGMLGKPTVQRRSENQTIYLYRYRPETTTRNPRPIEVTFIFDAASGQLRRLVGKLPRGTLNFDFAPSIAPSK